jgi:hypothetical protein
MRGRFILRVACAAFVAAVALAAACIPDALFLAPENGSPDAGSPFDAHSDSDARAASTDGGSPSDAQPVIDVSVSCGPDAGSGCIIVPNGWSLVAVDRGATGAPCPAGFGPRQDVFAGPEAGASACACLGCSITTSPSCTRGSVQVFAGIQPGAPCFLPGQPPYNNNNPAGGCDTDIYTGALNGYSLEFVPPAPEGGTCAASAAPQAQNVTFASHEQACGPAAPGAGNCMGARCTPVLPPPFVACLAAPGAQPCFAGLPHGQLVGTGANPVCPACACTVSAACGGTMTLYETAVCSGPTLTVPVDGQCHTNEGMGASYNSYVFAGTVTDAGCSASPVPPTSFALVAPETLCCP